MHLIITCTHSPKNKCSFVRFWLKNPETPKVPKKMVLESILPIQSARQSLVLFNSPYKPEFERNIKRMQETYNITPANTFSFTDSPKIKELYLRNLDKLRGENMELSFEERQKERQKRKQKKVNERKKTNTTYQREYRREYRKLEKLKEINPELYAVLKNKPRKSRDV